MLNVETDLRTACSGQCWSFARVCPGFIGTLAKCRIRSAGFLFLLFSVLHCIFHSNVKHHVSINSSSVFPQSIYISCTVYSNLYAAHCLCSYLPNLNKPICMFFPHCHLGSLSPKQAKIGHIYRSIACSSDATSLL